MKDFLKYVCATVVGIILFTVIAGILTMMSLVGMVASSQATKSIKDNSVLVLNLSGVMSEQAEEDFMSMISNSVSQQMGLQETLVAIKKAKSSDEVKGIYIEAGAFGADIAQIQEIRQALVDFKKSGKWIIAYGDVYTQGTYYLSSVADKVYLNPQGGIDWHGIGAQPMFVKDLLAKFGIKMRILKVGKYKSATEMFSEDKMTDFNRHQTEVYINGLWNNICREVGASRKLSVETLNAYADSLITFSAQQDLVRMKMVDGLLYHDQIRAEVKKLLELKEKDDINQVTISDMQNVKEDADGEKIAIYLAYGDIVDTDTEGLMGSNGHKIVSGPTCKDLEKLMNDDDVKAVVIRVNSPGGSAYASEQIWRQVSLLKEKKPVVISMGGYAASGGYYISCNANWIVAEPTTLTGSIGIFGMIPDYSQLVTQKLGRFPSAACARRPAAGCSGFCLSAARPSRISSAPRTSIPRSALRATPVPTTSTPSPRRSRPSPTPTTPTTPIRCARATSTSTKTAWSTSRSRASSGVSMSAPSARNTRRCCLKTAAATSRRCSSPSRSPRRSRRTLRPIPSPIPRRAPTRAACRTSPLSRAMC